MVISARGWKVGCDSLAGSAVSGGDRQNEMTSPFARVIIPAKMKAEMFSLTN
jgi:hypothetical protein